MDAYLYVMSLAVFGTLYLVLGIFLIFALLISLIALYLFLSLAYKKLPDDYPYSARDNLLTVTFIGVTWGFFTLIGPHNPIPFVGDGLTYSSSPLLPIDSVIVIAFVLLFAFLVIGAFVVPRLTDRGRGGSGKAGSDQGNITVGAG